jgi:hypothetical protein
VHDIKEREIARAVRGRITELPFKRLKRFASAKANLEFPGRRLVEVVV